MPTTWTDSTQEIAGTKMHVSRAGAGKPVLVLHHDIGTLDHLPFYDSLAATHDVIVPHHPGWGKSQRPDWLRHPRDMAAMYAWLLADLNATEVSLVGLGFGGWIAAEMAAQAPTAFKRLALVAPMGIKPPEGDIFDQAIVSYLDYPKLGFHSQDEFFNNYGAVDTDQLEQWDICREMVFRTAWKPYMYSQTLPRLLGGVRTPALLIWGDDNKIVPISAGHAYTRALRNATMTTVANCGHFAEMEKPAEVAKLVTDFLTAN
jgi:pimeloyl-ACP methyl ester carboxylesterase